MAGVIDWARASAFERVLWRACRGNVFVRNQQVAMLPDDPLSVGILFKTSFVVLLLSCLFGFCAHACARVCVRACVRARVCVCVCVCVCMHGIV